MNKKTISLDYIEKNNKLHLSNPNYGAGGSKWSFLIREIADQLKATTILDYGCGKQTLSKALEEFNVYEYDPAIIGLDEIPCTNADLIVCTDVLEHVEPDFIHAVLAEIADIATKAAFFTVATRPAIKFLSDGRNAHLIVKPFSWWNEIISQHFRIIGIKDEPNHEFSVLTIPRKIKITNENLFFHPYFENSKKESS